MKFIKSFFKKFFGFFKKPVVSILKIDGPIGVSAGFKSGVSFNGINSQIEEAFSYSNLKAVFININSPGGSPVQSELIYNRIRQLADEKKVKVIAVTEDMAASGGYFIALSGDEIYAAENSIIGSIGVISSGFGFDKLINKYGIERRVYTVGKNKSVLDPFKPEQKKDLTLIKSIQEDIFDNFKNLVTFRRNEKLDKKKDVFTGEFWTSKKAKELGLIDDIGYIYDLIKSKYGKKVNIKTVNQNKSWLARKIGLEFDSALDSFLGNMINYIEKRFLSGNQVIS